MRSEDKSSRCSNRLKNKTRDIFTCCLSIMLTPSKHNAVHVPLDHCSPVTPEQHISYSHHDIVYAFQITILQLRKLINLFSHYGVQSLKLYTEKPTNAPVQFLFSFLGQKLLTRTLLYYVLLEKRVGWAQGARVRSCITWRPAAPEGCMIRLDIIRYSSVSKHILVSICNHFVLC
jgi:hypothetical protein